MKKRGLFLILGLTILASSQFYFMSCNNDSDNGNDEVTTIYPTPSNISCSVIRTYPHDTSSFTQGLVIYKGELYEGTGDWGHSRLLHLDLASGKPKKELKLDSMYFGEGITIINDLIYQLTYKEGKVFVYSVADFKKVKEFDLKTEGWGLTNDGTHLIATNGSNDLFYYNPEDFSLVKQVDVYDAGTPAFNLNELEYIDGFIYANKWQSPEILKIDPATGHVVAKINLSDIVNKLTAKYPGVDFLNGIAYDADAKKIYVTGKNWQEM
jgi:glutaminyl-peptide cyclotransferase